MKGGSTALLHFVATCCMTRVPERRGGDWARVPRIRDRRAGRVRPRSGPRARCGRGFALKYASRRRREFPRGAPRRQGTGPCSSTRQCGLAMEAGRAERTTTRGRAHTSTTTSRATCHPQTREAWGRKTKSTSCQRWKRTGTSPSHPSASPLNRIVCLLRNCSWGGGLSLVPPEDSFCSAYGQVLACGRLRGASIHRAK
jgi:hypothetical protein